jgi:four helix bundle protein
MSTIKNFEDIICWKEARLLNRKMGKLLADNRFGNNFRLISQIEGSAGSIMDNIAEGFERGGNKEFIQFLYIAKGSCGELRSQMYRALDRNYILEAEFEEIANDLKQLSSLIQRFISYLESSSIRGIKYKKTDTKETTEKNTVTKQSPTPQNPQTSPMFA